jgi:hypothetical protein
LAPFHISVAIVRDRAIVMDYRCRPAWDHDRIISYERSALLCDGYSRATLFEAAWQPARIMGAALVILGVIIAQSRQWNQKDM